MRVIRVLVYEGDAEVVERTMRHNGVKTFHEIKGMRIYESMIGYAHPLEDENKPTTEETPPC